MQVVNIQKWLIAALLICTNNAVSAKEGGFYVSLQGGSEIHREVYDFKNVEDNDQSSEWNILVEQTKRIVEQCNKRLAYDLYKTLYQCNFFKLQIPTLETGIGYRFRYILPIALELKVMASSTAKQHGLFISPNSKHLFLHPNAKAFLPISSSSQLYVRGGKLFTLTQREVFFSRPEIDINSTWIDVTDTLFNTTPKEQWNDSMTLLGIGIISKLTSKLEYDFSVNGYTQRESTRIHFNTSFGINYLFW